MQESTVPNLVHVPTGAEKRSVARGLLFSGFIHVCFGIIASLIVLNHLNDSPPEPIVAGFEMDSDSAESMTLNNELDAPEVTAEVSIPELFSADVAMQVSPNTVPLELDLSRFGAGQSQSFSGLSDLATGIQERVGRAGGKTGEVQFSLSWHTTNDLDLHVITPAGEHISYRHRQSRCDGMLDVDMNVQPDSTEPVENVRWLNRSAPMGRYTILIHQYRWRAGQTSDQFELLVKLADESTVVEEQISAQSPLVIRRFQFVKPSLSSSRKKALLAQYEALQDREEIQAADMLENALSMTRTSTRDELLRRIIGQFAHTDASIRAMQQLTAESVKTQ